MAQGERTDLPPLPKCGCGCGQSVRRRRHRFLFGHVTLAARAQGGRKSGPTRRFLARRRLFGQVFDRMTRQGRSLTKEDILDAFADVHRHGYEMGYTAGRARLKVLEGQKSEAA